MTIYCIKKTMIDYETSTVEVLRKGFKEPYEAEAHILSLPQRVGSQKQIHNATPSDGRPTVLRLARKNDRNTAAARTGW